MAIRRFRLTITDPPSGNAPSWFTSMAPGTWKTVAAPTADVPSIYTQDAVKFTDPYNLSNLNGQETYNGRSPTHGTLNNYSGATADPDRREMLLVANGGHADYAGNEGYALALWEEAPYWYRLNDPTNPAGGMMGPAPTGFPSPARENDGRSRSMHTYGLQCYANGKVWYPHQGHTRSNAGVWMNAMCSYNRNQFRTGSAAGAQASGSVAWTNNAGPWGDFSTLNNSPHTANGSNQWSGSTSVRVQDSIGDRVVVFKRQDFATQYVVINAQTGSHNCYNQDTLGPAPTWAGADGYREAPVFVPDRSILGQSNGVILIFYRASNKVLIVSTPRLGLASNWVLKDISSGAPPAGFLGTGECDAASAVYHNGAVYFMNWAVAGSAIYKLTLPVDLVSGTWTWSTEKTHAENPSNIRNLMPVGLFSGQGMWGKFNIIPDMGNGQAAIVCVCSWSGATAVYKL